MAGRSCFTAALLFMTTAAFAAPVNLQTTDGISLSAEDVGSGETGVLLVHHKGRTKEDWDAFQKKAASRGFKVVAVDLRGHGASAGGKDDFTKMSADVDAGVAYLKNAGAKRIAVVGAELGANVALESAKDNADVNTVILLSASLVSSGLKSGPALEAYGDRPVLIVASEENAYHAKSAAYLEGKAKGQYHIEMLNGAGAGTKMLTRDPNLEGIVMSWLNDTFFLTTAEGQQKQLNTGDTSTVETTGTKFGDSREEKKKEPEEPMQELNLDD